MYNTRKLIDKSFKQRVAECAMYSATIYKKKFVEYDYLVCSEAFAVCHYQEIKAEESNYLHLLGINTKLSPKVFFNKCINKELKETDFDFDKPNQSQKSVKGSVRQKIKALPEMLDMFHKELFAEENFKKNKISCLFATADNEFTIGFTKSGRPKSLMRDNQLNRYKRKPVELVMRKTRSEKYYKEIIMGNNTSYEKYKNDIKSYINEDSCYFL